jgi:Methyltransferase domain
MAEPPAMTAGVMNCRYIAPWYESLERFSFGRALEHRRCAFLKAFADAENALVVGDGDGRFLRALLSSNTRLRADCVELCPQMVEICSGRIGRMGESFVSRARIHCRNIDSFSPDNARYDLIATHFFLDCFELDDARRIVEKIAGWAAPNGLWVVSEFRVPPRGIARFWGAALVQLLYFAFRVTTGLRTRRLPEYSAALEAAGFELARKEESWRGLLVSELWQRKTAA